MGPLGLDDLLVGLSSVVALCLVSAVLYHLEKYFDLIRYVLSILIENFD